MKRKPETNRTEVQSKISIKINRTITCENYFSPESLNKYRINVNH